jgi:hypothetical protein
VRPMLWAAHALATRAANGEGSQWKLDGRTTAPTAPPIG